jgi:hypothetical protein
MPKTRKKIAPDIKGIVTMAVAFALALFLVAITNSRSLPSYIMDFVVSSNRRLCNLLSL